MDDYDRYAELLVQKEEAERRAEEAGAAYLREFGKLIEDTFAINIEAIKLKKQLKMYQLALNRGELPDEDKINEAIEAQMKPYYERLKEEREDIAQAHKVIQVDTFDIEQSKRLYRKLMKLLHPDMNSLTADYPDLMELFNNIQIAYKMMDWPRLEELEVMVNAKLKELGIEVVATLIPDLDAKIEKVETIITHIMSTTPYTYRDLLASPAQLLEHNEYLESQFAEAVSYRDELLEKFNELKEGC